MILKRKRTEKILLKEKRTCYKARIFSNWRLGESQTDFEIYEIDKDFFIVFVNWIERYSCYNLWNAKSFCLWRARYFTLINE